MRLLVLNRSFHVQTGTPLGRIHKVKVFAETPFIEFLQVRLLQAPRWHEHHESGLTQFVVGKYDRHGESIDHANGPYSSNSLQGSL